MLLASLVVLTEQIQSLDAAPQNDDDYNLFKQTLMVRILKIFTPLGNIPLARDGYSSVSASSGAIAALPLFDPPSLVRFFHNLFCLVSVTASRLRLFRSLVS